MGSYLWVCLVLHALDEHALDNLHIMLLLVAEDSWEVPKEAKYTQLSATSVTTCEQFDFIVA